MMTFRKQVHCRVWKSVCICSQRTISPLVAKVLLLPYSLQCRPFSVLSIPHIWFFVPVQLPLLPESKFLFLRLLIPILDLESIHLPFFHTNLTDGSCLFFGFSFLPFSSPLAFSLSPPTHVRHPVLISPVSHAYNFLLQPNTSWLLVLVSFPNHF